MARCVLLLAWLVGCGSAAAGSSTTTSPWLHGKRPRVTVAGALAGLSPDGRYVATVAAEDGPTLVYATADGRRLCRLEGGNPEFGGGSRWIRTVRTGPPRQSILYRLPGGARCRSLESQSLNFGADGRTAVVVDPAGTTTFHSLPTWQVLVTSRAPGGAVAPSGRYALAVTRDRPAQVALYELATGRKLATLPGAWGAFVGASGYLVCGAASDAGERRLYRLPDVHKLAEWQGRHLAARDGPFLARPAEGDTTRVQRLPDLAVLATVQGDRLVGFSANARWMVTRDRQKCVRAWDTRTWKEVMAIPQAGVAEVEADGDSLRVRRPDAGNDLWSRRAAGRVGVFAGEIEVAGDGRLIAEGMPAGRCGTYKLTQNVTVLWEPVEAHLPPSAELTAAPMLAYSEVDWRSEMKGAALYLHDFGTGRGRRIDVPGGAFDYDWLPDGSALMVLNSIGALYRWDVANGELMMLESDYRDLDTIRPPQVIAVDPVQPVLWWAHWIIDIGNPWRLRVGRYGLEDHRAQRLYKFETEGWGSTPPWLEEMRWEPDGGAVVITSYWTHPRPYAWQFRVTTDGAWQKKEVDLAPRCRPDQDKAGYGKVCLPCWSADGRWRAVADRIGPDYLIDVQHLASKATWTVPWPQPPVPDDEGVARINFLALSPVGSYLAICYEGDSEMVVRDWSVADGRDLWRMPDAIRPRWQPVPLRP